MLVRLYLQMQRPCCKLRSCSVHMLKRCAMVKPWVSSSTSKLVLWSKSLIVMECEWNQICLTMAQWICKSMFFDKSLASSDCARTICNRPIRISVLTALHEEPTDVDLLEEERENENNEVASWMTFGNSPPLAAGSLVCHWYIFVFGGDLRCSHFRCLETVQFLLLICWNLKTLLGAGLTSLFKMNLNEHRFAILHWNCPTNQLSGCPSFVFWRFVWS